MASPLHPTVAHARAEAYLRPGGPWDVAALDDVLSAVPVTLVDDDRRLAAPAVEVEVERMARRLEGSGIGPDSVVAWQLVNRAEAWLLYRACWRVGAVATPVHHRAGPADVAAALDQVDPDLVLVEPTLAAADRADAVDMSSWTDAPATVAPMSRRERRIDPSSLAVVLFTSGSSGRPKAVLHTHRGLVAKAKTMADTHGLGPSDVVLMPAPLAHISGLLNGLLVPGIAGMKTVLMAQWDPAVALGLIETEAVTFMIGPPTFFLGLIDAPSFSARRVASLRLVSSGGAGVTPAFVDRAAAALGCLVKRTYGSTEVPTVTTSGPSDPPERARETDGRATGEAEVRVVDPVSGATLRPGAEGEVWLRGPEVCAGYVQPEATASAFTTDGWFRSGDLGTMDGQGWLTITGRMGDVIIRGGENITASEVEAALEAAPAVQQAVVVGVPDERMGQRVAAVVVARGHFGLEECRSGLAAAGITKFKWPEQVLQVDALPLLAAGKVDRAAVARMLGSEPG